MKRVVTTLITLSLAAGAGAAGARSPAPADPADQRACLAAAQYSDARRGLSVLVLRDGAVVCEHYAAGDAETGHELYSGTKSLVGLMAAAAVQDGLLTLDEPVSDTLPEWRDDPLKAQASVRQLLSMTAGLPFSVSQASISAISRSCAAMISSAQALVCGSSPYCCTTRAISIAP